MREEVVAFARLAIEEAIKSLGLVRPAALGDLEGLMMRTLALSTSDTAYHPRQLCTGLRKVGEQLPPEEKRAAGIRANGYMSREAFSQLTGKGRRRPLVAHEITLLRAMFSTERFRRTVAVASEADVVAVLVHRQLHWPCAGCARLAAVGPVSPSLAAIMPPKDCERESCSLSLDIRVDYYATELLRRNRRDP